MATATPITTPSRTSGPVGVRVLITVGLVLMCVVQLVPFWIALTTSIKAQDDLSSQWVPPTRPSVENFVTAVSSGHILQAIVNSVIVTGISCALVCLLAAAAAYPLARRATKLNGIVVAVILGLIMIPPLSILVPLYTMLTAMHLNNTYLGEILVMVTTHLPIAVFLYRAFFRDLPTSMEEAARMDGANVFQVLLRIVLPVLRPVTATVLILTGISIWNDYALSAYIVNAPEVQTIAPAVATFFSEQSSNLGAASAAALLGLLPVLIAYLFLQRYFLKGMLAGAEKG